MKLTQPYLVFRLFLLSLLLTGSLSAQTSDSNLLDITVKAGLELLSSPDSATVTINDSLSMNVTPLTLRLSPGKYQLDIAKDGYEPLTHHLNLVAGQQLTARFILSSFPPPPIPAESLDLFYLPEKPPIDIKEVDRLSQTFKRMAETFAIIPLGQGIIARMIVDKENQDQANILIASGIVLSGGSLLMGKILTNKRRRAIESENARIVEENQMINKHNRDVDHQVKNKNDEALQMWLLENKDRGRVIINAGQPKIDDY